MRVGQEWRIVQDHEWVSLGQLLMFVLMEHQYSTGLHFLVGISIQQPGIWAERFIWMELVGHCFPLVHTRFLSIVAVNLSIIPSWIHVSSLVLDGVKISEKYDSSEYNICHRQGLSQEVSGALLGILVLSVSICHFIQQYSSRMYFSIFQPAMQWTYLSENHIDIQEILGTSMYPI